MIDLTVKTLDSQNHAFSLDDDQITVRGFKEYIAESVAVPADSQRLIYCGRVLQDEKKLNDYDVNGKVIHLVQRAPPQPGQRGNDNGQMQGQGHSRGRQNPQRPHYRLTRTPMHGNAMYLGAMSVPAEIVEGLPVPQLTNSLSNSRLVLARRMLDRTNGLIDRLRNPSAPPAENCQPASTQQGQAQELETEGNNNGLLAEVTEEAADTATATSTSIIDHNVPLQWNANESVEPETGSDNGENQADAQQQQQQPQQAQSDQESTSTADAQTNRRLTLQHSYPPQMEELMRRLLSTFDRLRPYLDRYCSLMLTDPVLQPGPGPDGVEENQNVVDGVSECLHCISHACHALSDIIVDMSQQPPRNLRCRPIIIQHSAILQPGIPIQVEAHISLHGHNVNNNNGNEESNEGSSTASQPESSENNAQDSGQQQESETASQQPAEQQQQEQTQSPFGAVFNLHNNVEVLMEVSPESNIDVPSGSEQGAPGETNNNNNSTGRMNGSVVLPWGSRPPSVFARNLMQAVAGHILGQGGIATTSISTQNPTASAIPQQPIITSIDSGNTNAGQSTQARSNVGTHPTTATQTRSTSRPHVFHQQSHPLGVGMAIGQALDFDPYLPCNSHHIRRPSTTSGSTVTATSQGTRANQATSQSSDNQTQAQTATTSSSTSSTASTNPSAPPTTEANPSNPYLNLFQQLLGSAGSSLAETLGNTMQILSGGNIHVGTVTDNRGSSSGSPRTPRDRVTTQNVRRLEEDWEQFLQIREPLEELLQPYLSNTTTPEATQDQTADALLLELRPHVQHLLAAEQANVRSGTRVDLCATVESLLHRHIKDILRTLFSTEIDDHRFGREILSSITTLARQICAVLRHSIGGGQPALESIATRLVHYLSEGSYSRYCLWLLNVFTRQCYQYLRIPQPPDSEICPLLVYKDSQSQTTSAPSATTQQSSQAQPDVQPMETEPAEERTTYEASLADDGEDIPETFPGHESLPSEWVPIIARDSVRQRRQLQQMQGIPANGGMTPFSDAYLGALPTKRRKIIGQQKSRLLVSPTPNHSAIAASMERLVREGVGRAGVEEVEGAAVAVAADPGVRRAFGQAIRDCLHPQRYGTPDFPDPLRFPNATKYFAEQERSPK